MGAGEGPGRPPADADALIHALEEARDHILGSETRGQRTASFAAAGAYVGTLESGAGAAGPPTGEQTYDLDQPHRRRPPWWAWVLGLLAVAGVVAAVVLLTQTKQVTVPGVVGQEMQVAQRRLEAAQLEWSIERVESTKPIDEVVDQSPAQGRRVDESTLVRLKVSGGPGTIDVPAVDGFDVAKATAALHDAGLTVGDTIEQADATVPEGNVIRSSPAAGRNVRRGGAVTLYVSTGPPQVSVPDVTGFTRADAESTLSGAGFRTSVTEQESSSADAGDVISQNPEGGADADDGSTIALVVARAPPIEIPGVVGQARPDAEAALTDAGLTPRVSLQNVEDPAQDGIVLAQRPEQGTTAARGAPVRIFVGRYVEPVVPPPGDGTTTTPGDGTQNGAGDGTEGGGAPSDGQGDAG